MTEKHSAEAQEATPEKDRNTGAENGADAVTDTLGAHAGAADAGSDSDDQAGIDALRERAEAAEAKAQEHWDRILRMEAEKDNIRKRAEKDIANARRQALEKFANEMLAVRDSLELGRDAALKEDADLAQIREGTELTLNMLTQAMAKFDIEEINPVGEKFDPDLHQAMSTQEASDEQPANTVTMVMQKGYRLDDRLLRPALVVVAK